MRKLLGRDDHLGDKLVAPDGGDLGLDDEIIHLHPPLTIHALQHHLRVQQDQRPCRSGFNPVDGLTGVVNAGGFQPHLAQHGGQQPEVSFVIIHHQHGFTAKALATRAFLRGKKLRCKRQGERKFAAFPRLAGDR